jgi:hypothetical protein
MNRRRFGLGLGLTAAAGLALVAGSANAMGVNNSVAGMMKQRFGGNVAGARVQGPAAGGSIRFNQGMGAGISPMGLSPAAMGTMRFGGAYNPTQGIQPANLRVPFTYTPGGPFYANRLPWGNFNYNWGGVPYFWYNNFWYRSMWYRGLPYYFAIPIETVPPQVVQQWTLWNQLKAQENERKSGTRDR